MNPTRRPAGHSGQRATGRGWGGYSNSRFSDRPTTAGHCLTSPAPALGALLQTIIPGQVDTNVQPPHNTPTIEGCKYVASYNWLETRDATILIPGSPPTWLPPGRAFKLKEDKGTYFRDPNATHYPSYPVEPAVRALLTVNPEYDCLTVDIVGCGSTFGSLLSACRPSDDRTFSFGVERIGKTVFLVRQTLPNEVIEDVRGYGHSFPDAYTSWPKEVKGSASHQRIIEYRFGGLKCLMRSESDGYLPEKVAADDSSATTSTQDRNNATLDDATKMLQVGRPAPAKGSNLSIRRAGQTIPQSAIFDLKTRSARRHVDNEEFLPRLWVNQTPNFIFARHESGVFKEVDIHDVRAAVKGWEVKNSKVLRSLQNVLSKLIEITRQDGCSRIQVRRLGVGPLQIRKPTMEWSVLPSDLKAKWQGKTLVDGQGDLAEDAEPDSDDDDNEDYLKF